MHVSEEARRVGPGRCWLLLNEGAVKLAVEVPHRRLAAAAARGGDRVLIPEDQVAGGKAAHQSNKAGPRLQLAFCQAKDDLTWTLEGADPSCATACMPTRATMPCPPCSAAHV